MKIENFSDVGEMLVKGTPSTETETIVAVVNPMTKNKMVNVLANSNVYALKVSGVESLEPGDILHVDNDSGVILRVDPVSNRRPAKAADTKKKSNERAESLVRSPGTGCVQRPGESLAASIYRQAGFCA